MKEFKREGKYLVLKWDDIDKWTQLNKNALIDWKSLLDGIIESISKMRQLDGKGVNSYVVVNEDEPYAEQVWQLIQKHWEANQ